MLLKVKNLALAWKASFEMMPRVLKLVSILSFLVGPFVLISAVALHAGIATYTINDVEVTREEFIATASTWEMMMIPLFGVMVITAGVGLFRIKKWARGVYLCAVLMIFSQSFVSENGPSMEHLSTQLFVLGINVAIIYWYLFKKKSVCQYFGIT